MRPGSFRFNFEWIIAKVISFRPPDGKIRRRVLKRRFPPEIYRPRRISITHIIAKLLIYNAGHCILFRFVLEQKLKKISARLNLYITAVWLARVWVRMVYIDITVCFDLCGNSRRYNIGALNVWRLSLEAGYIVHLANRCIYCSSSSVVFVLVVMCAEEIGWGFG